MADSQGHTAASRRGGPSYERGTRGFDAATDTLRALTNSFDSNGCAGLHDLRTASAPFATVLGLHLLADGTRLTPTKSNCSSVDTLFRLTK